LKTSNDYSKFIVKDGATTYPRICGKQFTELIINKKQHVEQYEKFGNKLTMAAAL